MKFLKLIMLSIIVVLSSYEGMISFIDLSLKENCCSQETTNNTCQNKNQEPCTNNEGGMCNPVLSCHFSGFVITKIYKSEDPYFLVKEKVHPIFSLGISFNYSNANWRPPRV